MSRQLSLFQFVSSNTNSSPSPNPDLSDPIYSPDPTDSSNATDSSVPVLTSDIDPSHSSNPSPSSSRSIAINDIAPSVTSPPVQPIHGTFQVTYFSRKARSFLILIGFADTIGLSTLSLKMQPFVIPAGSLVHLVLLQAGLNVLLLLQVFGIGNMLQDPKDL